LGLAVLAPFLVREARQWTRLSRRGWLSVLAIALLGGTVGTIAYTAALGSVQYIQFSVVVLLQQLQPVFAIALAGLVLGEPIRGRFIGLALLALLAAYFVSFPDLRVNLTTGAGTAFAALLALLAAFSWGASTVLGRYALARLSFISLSGLRFLFTSVFAFLYMLSLEDLDSLGAISSTQWWYIMAIVFSTGLVALLIYYKGLSHVPARISTLLELTWPLSAIFIEWLFFGNTFSATQWLGAVVLLGVIIKISRDFGRGRADPAGAES
ncbi:MAG: EamA family transporter, partial [Parcubacteria group bacterium]|nr:EamA family transporter [Parcubacteria group bacterium]